MNSFFWFSFFSFLNLISAICFMCSFIFWCDCNIYVFLYTKQINFVFKCMKRNCNWSWRQLLIEVFVVLVRIKFINHVVIIFCDAMLHVLKATTTHEGPWSSMLCKTQCCVMLCKAWCCAWSSIHKVLNNGM
jgi:hypothetical protein